MSAQKKTRKKENRLESRNSNSLNLPTTDPGDCDILALVKAHQIPRIYTGTNQHSDAVTL